MTIQEVIETEMYLHKELRGPDSATVDKLFEHVKKVVQFLRETEHVHITEPTRSTVDREARTARKRFGISTPPKQKEIIAPKLF